MVNSSLVRLFGSLFCTDTDGLLSWWKTRLMLFNNLSQLNRTEKECLLLLMEIMGWGTNRLVYEAYTTRARCANVCVAGCFHKSGPQTGDSGKYKLMSVRLPVRVCTTHCDGCVFVGSEFGATRLSLIYAASPFRCAQVFLSCLYTIVMCALWEKQHM